MSNGPFVLPAARRTGALTILLGAVLLFPGLAPGAAGQDLGASAPRYGRLEMALPSVRVAPGANVYLPYEENAYGGAEGVTVNAVLTAPGGGARTVPCFYMERMAPVGDGFAPTGEAGWYLRFSPDREGAWSGRVVVTDKEGTRDGGEIAFSCDPSAGKGFVQVSSRDPRYLQFSDGTTLANGPGYHRNAPADLGRVPAGSLVRTWWNGTTAPYSPWDIGGQGGRSNWGTSHTPEVSPLGAGHLSVIQKVRTDGTVETIELKAARGRYRARYRWTATLKIENVTGPYSTTHPQLGSQYGPCLQITDNAAGVDAPVNTQWLVGTQDWTTIGGDFTLNNSTGEFRWVKMRLRNCTGGTAYWASASLREVKSDGTLGPELLELTDVNVHKRYGQTAAYRADRALEAAAARGAYLKVVLFEKLSHVWGRWQPDGSYQTGWDQNGPNFYGPTDPDQMTFTRWHQKAAVRYFMARYGWSPHLAQAEFCNEGDPASQNHAAGTLFFTRQLRSHGGRPAPILGGTSNWHSLPTWMKDPARVDAADLHSYPATLDMRVTNASAPAWGGDAAYDTALLHPLALTRFTPGLKLPFLWGEIAIHQNGDSDTNVAKDTGGVWLHKATWAGLAPDAAYLFWWYMREIVNYDLYRIGAAFLKFTAGLDLAGGGYVDAAPQVSGTGAADVPVVRALGQKNPAKGLAHLWIDNPAHTYQAVITGAAVPAAAGTVTIAGMPDGWYTLDWHDTGLGEIVRTEPVECAGGAITVSVSGLATDLAFKLRAGAGAPDPAPAPGPAAITLDPPAVVGGTPSTGTVALTGPAPDGGVTVTLASNNAAAGVPASVTVPAGAYSAAFMISTVPVPSDVGATISARANGTTADATITVEAPQVLGLAFSPETVAGRQTTRLTVTLTGAAPPGGVTVALATANAKLVPVPSTAAVAAGSSSVTLSITTGKVTGSAAYQDVTVTGTRNGTSRSATVRVTK